MQQGSGPAAPDSAEDTPFPWISGRRTPAAPAVRFNVRGWLRAPGSEDARNATEKKPRTPYWAMPARSPETSISTSNWVRVTSSSEQPAERYAGASRSARNRSRSWAESQIVMAHCLPSTTRRQPSGGTGPELRTCLLISSCCSSVRLVSSMMLQMASRTSSVAFESDRRPGPQRGHQCDCGFATERLFEGAPGPTSRVACGCSARLW